MKHQLAQPEALQFLWNRGQRTCKQSTTLSFLAACTCRHSIIAASKSLCTKALTTISLHKADADSYAHANVMQSSILHKQQAVAPHQKLQCY